MMSDKSSNLDGSNETPRENISDQNLLSQDQPQEVTLAELNNHTSPTKQTDLLEPSPSKSRNKRRNEAKRRSNTAKKQTQPLQQAITSAISGADQTTQDNYTFVSRQQSNIPETVLVPVEKIPKEPQQDADYDSNALKVNNRMKENDSKDANAAKLETTLQQDSKPTSSKSIELQYKLERQSIKNRELEIALLKATKTCNQLERLLQQELTDRTRLESEISGMQHMLTRLKSQLNVSEKSRSNDEELIRVLNATLMERETEVSILKLKLTRLHSNTTPLHSASSFSSVKNDPCQAFSSNGRSNSEFDRNSYLRSTMKAEVTLRSSLSHLRGPDRDASIWATVPEELTPSKRPAQLINRAPDPTYSERQLNNLVTGYSSTDYKTSTPLRDSRYRTMPRSMRGFSRNLSKPEQDENKPDSTESSTPQCQVTNLDDSNNSSQSSGNKTTSFNTNQFKPNQESITDYAKQGLMPARSQQSQFQSDKTTSPSSNSSTAANTQPIETPKLANPHLAPRTPSSPVKLTSGIKRIFEKLRRAESNHTSSRTDITSPTISSFKRGENRATLIGGPGDLRKTNGPINQAINLQIDKPFAEWDSEMIAHWLTLIGLSMYAGQCRRCVKVGAHIMNATPAEVDKWLGITNHLHSKKLRLAISELNGDCDKVTKAAAKLDYLWVARWLDDIGLPQHKEAFINARVDGRVLNYLTVDDLITLNVRSLLHHASIRCGIKVLRSIDFDLQFLKRRATADEVELMNSIRQNMNKVGDTLTVESTLTEASNNSSALPLWTCHRVMEWLRLIDFAEFASNLRGSGVHGGLIIYEAGFTIDTMCSLLSIPSSRTLLRRHLSTFFNELIGVHLTTEKNRYKEISSNILLNPTAEIKTNKKTAWLNKLKSPKVAQDTMDEYLCPMYPVEPPLLKRVGSKPDNSKSPSEIYTLSQIPESINV